MQNTSTSKSRESILPYVQVDGDVAVDGFDFNVVAGILISRIQRIAVDDMHREELSVSWCFSG